MNAAADARRVPDPVAEATRIQREAADPAVSAAVRASAGSGKTHVLVARVVRLCLAGAEPKSIVAVTFTKKAAVEIKARLLRTLRDLAAATPAARRDALRELLGRDPEPPELARAAILYDRFLEDPPGLPIGTIHAWCQRLLGRFAADLGLDPAFRVLERPDDLWEEALDLLEREAAADPAARAALAGLASSPPEARKALTRLYQDRLALDRWLGRVGGDGETSPLAASRRARHAALVADLERTLLRGTALAGRAGATPADAAAALAEPARALAAHARHALGTLPTAALTAALRRQYEALAAAPALAEAVAAAAAAATAAITAATATTAATPAAATVAPAAAIAAGAGAAAAAAAAADETALNEAVSALRDRLLTKGGQPKLRSLQGGKAGKEERQEAFASAARPLLEALALFDLLALLRRNARLLWFGLGALDHYERLKRRERGLDFHDLERLARHLVAHSEQRDFVQCRLDAETEHLLVDEFQDTNHNQWDVLQPLVREFLAGEGAHGTPPTVFVVGDVKQSIYRFRGAEPRLFRDVEAFLQAAGGAGADGGGKGGDSGADGAPRALLRSLPTNFRSVPAVVDAVGRLFSAEPLRSLLPEGEAAHVAQFPSRPPSPGNEVVVVPPFLGPSQDGPIEQAARAAALTALRLKTVARVTERDGSSRPLAWSDILVLCRYRTHVGAYEDALRRAGVPIAPSGRGALARSREVQDILSLLRWLAFPEDDPALAAVLRSPLFRVSEAGLHRALARRRRRLRGKAFHLPLWTVLFRHGSELELAEPARLLAEWRKHAGLEGCHELLRRVYRDADALERFAAALGEQARWNLLRLHDLALALDLGPHPSLRRFAASIARAAETAGEEEASVPEHGEGRVQVMTVHAAKGLEKPAVLLVDAASPLRRGESRLRLDPGNHESPLLYGVTRRLRDGPELPPGQPAVRPGALAAAVDAARREAENEDADVLYVALTRARDRLYVLGSRRERDAGRPNYHEWLCAAAANAGLSGEDGGESPVRFASPAWLAESAGDAPSAAVPGANADAGAPGDVVVPGDAVAPGADRTPPAGDVVIWRPPPTHPRVELCAPSALASSLAEVDEGGQRFGREDAWADALAGGAAGAAAVADGDPARAGPPQDPEEAATRGTAIHLWLRLAAEPGGLPPDGALLGAAAAAGTRAGAQAGTASAAQAGTAAGAQAGAQPGWQAEALAEARAVAANPALAWIFRPTGEDARAWSEAPLLHEIPPAAAGGVALRVHGAIDRLVRRGNRVAVIDYKSNRLPADPARAEAEIARLTAHYAPQLAAYRAAAAALFPDCETTAHVLFTNARDERGGQGRLVAVPSLTAR